MWYDNRRGEEVVESKGLDLETENEGSRGEWKKSPSTKRKEKNRRKWGNLTIGCLNHQNDEK